MGRVVWCFTTRGMCNVGQEEIVLLLECSGHENTVPKDVFIHFQTVFEEASKGKLHNF